jgi:general secretion pathway protein D
MVNAVGGGMNSAPMRTVLALVLVAPLLTAGCAARWAYRQGQSASEMGDWDLAVARYTRALEKDPNNIGYKIALENARLQASRLHYDSARKALAANDFPKAAEELEIAVKFDPGNRSAADDLQQVRDRTRKAEEDKAERAEFEATRARAQAAARAPLPVLSPRSPVPITMKFESASLQKILESLGKIAGVNVLFDESFRDKRDVTVNLSGVTFQEALDRVTFVNRLFYKVLDQNTLIIVPESRQKRQAYDELLLRTFFVQNADINETVNLVKTLAKVQTVAGNQALNAITVLGTLDQIAMADRLIELNDKPRGEILVEVQILEVNRNATKEWGINLSNYNAGLTLSPTGSENEITAGLLNIRAHLLSSLNQADWVVSLPSSVFARFLQTDSTTRILAAPRLRAAEGKKAELKIGTEVPVPQTSYTVGTGGTTGYLPATSFSYRNVGVNLTLTPRVAASGDITMELTAEFSLLGSDRNVGSADNPVNVPTFLTRNVTGTLRLRDGETGLIGGLLQGNEASNFTGALGMNSIPIIGKLFGQRKKQKDESEVLISITPRIVRGPKVFQDDMVPLRVGTQEVPRVEGLRGSIFGPAPEPAATPPGPTVPQAPPNGGPTTPPGARPLANSPAAAPPILGAPPAQQPQAPLTAVPQPPGAGPEGAAVSTPERPPSAILSPPEVDLRVGQNGTVAIVVVGAKDVVGIDLSLVWDGALAEVTEATAGSLLSLDGVPLAAERALETGHARVKFTRASGVTGSGAVATLTLRGLKPGSGALSVESLTLLHAGGGERPAVPAAGRLVVTP